MLDSNTLRGFLNKRVHVRFTTNDKRGDTVTDTGIVSHVYRNGDVVLDGEMRLDRLSIVGIR